ncbi:MAG: hypothetical protein JSV80_04950, partial [Acidobacteriota bacterium]
ELFDAERLEQDEEGGEPLVVSGGVVELPLAAYETATLRVRAELSWLPIELTVDKNVAAGEVLLEWSGGVSPYTLRRYEDVTFTGAVETLVDEQDDISHADPVLADGVTYFYLVD